MAWQRWAGKHSLQNKAVAGKHSRQTIRPAQALKKQQLQTIRPVQALQQNNSQQTKLAGLSPRSAGWWRECLSPTCLPPTYRLCLSLSIPTPLICKNPI